MITRGITWPRAINMLVLITGILFFGCGPNKPEEIIIAEQSIPETIDYNFHVKPILSDRCFACHGPDSENRKADLRLDDPLIAFSKLEEGSGKRALVKGNLHKSEVFHRILSSDPEQMMPPPEANLALTDREKAILIRWIEQGATYKPHWAFIPPRKAKLPKVSQPSRTKNAIDNFVMKRLDDKGLTPTSEADKITLLRRVSFDLTGLPPTLKEIDEFISDTSINAYEKVVDRLLDSPQYGERMTLEWMDIARYADSHGYHADGYRMMWPWRDWVIKAFNQNLSYDQFIRWQLAGDLIPNASQEQVLATGFHRNNPINSESGIVPEEYRLENVFDRTNTTAKAFLGLTMECARCHDHKYDPLSQKEYYQFAAFFNNVDELGMIGNDGNTAPTIPLMTDEVANIVAFLREEITEKEQHQETYRKAFEAPEESNDLADIDPNYLKNGLVGHYPLDQIAKEETPNKVRNGKKASFKGDIEEVEGWTGKAMRFDSEYEFLSLPDIGHFERTDDFSMGVWVKPEIKEEYAVVMGNAGGKNTHWRGYELFLDEKNRVSVRLTHGLPDHCLYVTTTDSIPLNEWSHLMFTYDGSSKASGISVYIDGKKIPVEVSYDRLYKSILPINNLHKAEARAIRVGRSYRGALDIGLFEGAIDEIRVYNRKLSGLEVAGVADDEFWKGKNSLNPDEEKLLAEHYLLQQDSKWLAMQEELDSLRQKEHDALDTVPEIMVMREMNPPRKTFVLDRGVYDSPKEEVSMAPPVSVASFSDSLHLNRLGLANWLLSPRNPLTARVIVNRHWYMLFGRGLVNTLEDFGNQGALPTHPDLLDWLAIEFQTSGWDLKHLLRLIVTSSTYRQSSVASKELLEIDPQNELLARGPRHRLSAEMVRDNALMASGLLVDKIGGPSVKTYQPDDLWDKTHFSRLLTKYEPDSCEKLYRRSMYIFIRRTAPPPSMTVMDASDRSMCIVRRQNTSTPLQVLLLLNEPQLLEASRILAERTIKEGGESLEEQLDYGFRLLTSRHLQEQERALMKDLFEEEYERYQNDEKGADTLLSVGEFPRDSSLYLPEVAAMTVVMNMMMNFDETTTKR